jgi:hypothetical protein
MKEPKDKRTNAYKDWKKKQDLEKKEKVEFKEAIQKKKVGLGDVIETVTKATGIKTLVDKVTADEDCGCGDRKIKANRVKLFNKDVTVIYPEKYDSEKEFMSYLNNNKNKNKKRFTAVRLFTEKQYNTWCEFTDSKGDLNQSQISLIHEVYEQLFARTFKRQSCCYEGFINDINYVFNEY